MSRRSTTQAEVLRAVRSRLLQSVDGLNENTVLITLEPSPPEFPSHKFFISICPTDGAFDGELMDGGGNQQTAEHAGVCVTLFFRTQLDRNNQSESALLNEAEGLLRQKSLVLKSLTCHDLSVGTDQILMEPMKPLSSTAPKSAPKEERLTFSQLYFSTDFVWDLGTE